MTLVIKYGVPMLWKPICDVLQRWRISLASLLFFTIFLTNNFGLSTNPGTFGLKISTLSRMGQSTNWILSDTFSFLKLVNCTNCTSPENMCLVRNNASTVCENEPVNKRVQLIRRINLRFCPGSVVDRSNCSGVIEGSADECKRCFMSLENLEVRVYAMFEQFQEVLERVDCNHNFSTHWTCQDCKTAYKDWLCAMAIPYYLRGLRVLPCSEVCQQVEKRCPYFLPQMDFQYAGEPSFICTDSHIPVQASGVPSRGVHTDVCYIPRDGHLILRNISLTLPKDSHDVASLPAIVMQTSHNSTASSSSNGTQTCHPCLQHTLTLLLVAQVVLLWVVRTVSLHRVIGLT